MKFKNKTAIITGGASGIGAATVRKMVAQGATVYLTDVQTELGNALAKETGAIFVEQDVASEVQWKEVVDRVLNETGRLDVLVNNAGIFQYGSVEDFTLESMQQVLNVNLIGVALGCREAIRAMKKNPGGPSGSIINISSITGFVGLPRAIGYTASKGGARLLSKSVAVHCAKEYQNIRCNSVHPGAIDTPMNHAAFAQADDPVAMRQAFENLQPNGRMTSADEVADGILYLASDEASSVNGTELTIDGGWLAMPPGM